MDFFERQDHARRQTRLLLVLFTLSVLAIIAAIYLLAAVLISQGDKHRTQDGQPYVERPYGAPPAMSAQHGLWNPGLLLAVAAGTTLVIAAGSLYKIAELSSGGETVALMLGGRPVDAHTTNLAERRLLNVVEEMALAAGLPVPPVYVLEQEPGINAFAAGHQPGDAVVAVSRGCLQYLNREELQGVIGHEFSHILNGDMRLNLRLIGLVNGILVLAIVGYYVMRSAGMFSSRDDKKENAALVVFLLGLALLILGYIGVFFSNLIKSAVSRQREYLADASSVQFTRNPGGICGALKKIGGFSGSSRIRDAHAKEVSHMFFGDAFAGSFFNLFATHPPLEDRIRAFEPNFDGHFPAAQPVAAGEEPAVDAELAATRASQPAAGALSAAAAGFAGAAGAAPTAAAVAQASVDLDAGRVLERVRNPQREDMQHLGRTAASLPPVLATGARDPFTAPAVIYTLLLSRDDEGVRARQMQLLTGRLEPPVLQQVQRLAAEGLGVAAGGRLSLVDLAIPALKRSSAPQYQRFRENVSGLVNADGRLDLFEYCLCRMLFSYLDVHFGLQKPPSPRFRTVSSVAQPASVVLSMLANVGQQSPADGAQAFQAAATSFGVPLTLVPAAACTLQALDAALGQLAQAVPSVKASLLTAVVACIADDEQITLEEGELLRAIAAALACPLPPLPKNLTL